MSEHKGYFLRNFTKSSGSALPKGESVTVTYVCDGLTNDQVQYLVEDAATRLYASDVARPGASAEDVKSNASVRARWEKVKEEKRFAMHLAKFVGKAGAGVETWEEEVLRRTAAGEAAEDVLNELCNRVLQMIEQAAHAA